MKKPTLILLLFVGAGAGVWSLGNMTSWKNDTTTTIAESKQRCSSCDGTGFAPNAKGEKGKGKYTCNRCKGTGKI